MEDKLEVLIREFRQPDVDALFFLHQRCYPPHLQLKFSGLLDLLLHRDAGALVAEAGDETVTRVLAALVVRGQPWQREMALTLLMVDPPFRRAGIGRRLLTWAARLAAGFELERLSVGVPTGRPESEAFLEATGFARAGVKDDPETGPPQADGETIWTREVGLAPPT